MLSREPIIPYKGCPHKAFAASSLSLSQGRRRLRARMHVQEDDSGGQDHWDEFHTSRSALMVCNYTVLESGSFAFNTSAA
jgi:hypothetical protein